MLPDLPRATAYEKTILSKEKLIPTPSKEVLPGLAPREALERLRAGNRRFIEDHLQVRDLSQQVQDTRAGQSPFTLILGCIDSRVPPELVFDLGIGEAFTIRIAGNIVNEDILGSMEFATKVVGVKLVLVLGHTSCGAIQGAFDDVELGNLTGLLEKLKPAVESVVKTKSPDQPIEMDEIAAENVRMTMEDIKQRSPILKELWEAGEIAIQGAMYDVSSGQVTFL